MTNRHLDIRIPRGSPDVKLFYSVIREGIDARLEAFTESTFGWEGHILCLSFDPSEIQILIRRLVEKDTDEANQWADDIVFAEYGVEAIL